MKRKKAVRAGNCECVYLAVIVSLYSFNKRELTPVALNIYVRYSCDLSVGVYIKEW
jgi:hypothetical protein